MAIITFKGNSRRNNPTLGINLIDQSFVADEMIVVFVSFQGNNPPNSVFIQDTTIELAKAYQRLDTVNGFGAAVYVLPKVWEDLSLVTVRATWAAQTDYCVMGVYTVDGQYKLDKDVCARALSANTSEPTSSSTTEHKDRDSIAFGVLTAQGPETDVNLTPSAGWSTGSKKGTTNVTAINNVTHTILYQSLSVADPISAAGTGATIRNWVNMCVVFRPVPVIATDVNGSVIFIGNTVTHEGTRYLVLDILRNRNVIVLETIGAVSATETQLVDS